MTVAHVLVGETAFFGAKQQCDPPAVCGASDLAGGFGEVNERKAYAAICGCGCANDECAVGDGFCNALADLGVG
jgi:hypothetical protein